MSKQTSIPTHPLTLVCKTEENMHNLLTSD